MTDTALPTLHICSTCRTESDAGAGAALAEAVTALNAAADVPACHVATAVCFASCERGCTAVMSAPGKWSYLMGGLDAGHAADLLAYAGAFAASPTGVVLRSGRPESLHHAIIARTPATIADTRTKDAAE